MEPRVLAPELRDVFVDPEPWRADAACLGENPEWWHPRVAKVQTLDERRQTAMAVEICGECPVRAKCLGFALDHREFGIWGGTTENQRRRLRRLSRIAN